MKKIILFLNLLFITTALCSQNFNDYFVNKTLRIDYIFSGNASSEYIAPIELSQLPQWAGRHNNLDSLLLKGNGQIKVIDLVSRKCIYRDAFSTLFQEWQTTPEAKKGTQSFENTFLVPYPKNKVEIQVSMRQKNGLYKTTAKHVVDPNDILIKKKGLKNITPHTYMHIGDTANINRCVNVVIVAEGFTAAEMPAFREKAKETCDHMFMHSPFKDAQEKFNFIAVESPSIDSNVSIPRQNTWRSTAVSSHFDTFYSDRYLTTSHIRDMHDLLAGIPYAHIIVLANTDTYGGGGIFNSYTLTTTKHEAFGVVVVHEFGHSFGGLADEYYYEGDTFSDTYPLGVEPWEPNITTLVSFGKKWKSLLTKGTPVPTPAADGLKYPVGVFEGAGYSAKKIYRPAIDCRMKTNTCKDFCPACSQSLSKLIKFYTE